MNCNKASKLLSAATDRGLSRREQWSLQLHLIVCSTCRRFRDQLSLLRTTLALAPEKVLAAVATRSSRLSRERKLKIKAMLSEISGS